LSKDLNIEIASGASLSVLSGILDYKNQEN
jgi:hypothetical protein